MFLYKKTKIIFLSILSFFIVSFLFVSLVNADTGTSTYFVDYGIGSDLSNEVSLNPSGNNATLQLSNLAANTSYSYKIKTVASDGTTTFSSIYTFKTNPAGNNTPTPTNTPGCAAGANCIHIQLSNPLKNTETIPDFIVKVMGAVVLLLTPLVVLMLLYTGFLFVTARGNEENITTAKTTLLYTVIGAVLVIGAKGFATIIQNVITCFGGTNC